MEEEAIPIARLQRFATERAIQEQWPLFTRKSSTGKKVAIIGAGPSGLSCAHALSREGVDVTIYEKESKGGGLMTYGIAAYKVTPQFCQEEVDYITSIGGIEILYNQELGKNISLDTLQKNYDAVYLAFGVGLARQLEIPGEQLHGVVDAISFIYDIRTKGYPAIPVGDQVAVIGMGMTAIDAATQAKRLGAKEVTLVYRRTQQEMPCTEAELNIAKLDGCKIVWLAAPKEITGEDGKATQLVCNVVKLDATGAMAATGEIITLPVDMVIKAAGQMPFEELVHSNQLDNSKGKVIIDGNSTTSIKGVFAGGDCVNGGKEVVDAVQAGKDSAKAILQYLF
jgi:glutamate synthase (NADPH/NADH) small chain